MKSLSIKQPWASLIVHGIKDIENRTWPTKFRGKIYIHASAKFAEVYFTKDQISVLSENGLEISGSGYPSDFVTSAIIGEVEIVDCVVNHPSIWAEKTNTAYQLQGEETSEDYPKPIYNWVLANAVLYEKPILNVKGKLSFWEPDFDIVECIGCSDKFNSDGMEEDDAG